MNVVFEAACKKKTCLYVHDNFITTPTYTYELAKIYSDVFWNLQSPLELINILIDVNLIKPILSMDINDKENIISYDTRVWLSKIKANSDHYVKYPIPLNPQKEIWLFLRPNSISKREG